MEVVKKKINNYDVFIHNTSKYATIKFSLFFELPYTKKNIYVCDLLAEYMIHTCKKYPTRKLLHDKLLDMYSMTPFINNYNVGEKLFVQVDFVFYDPILIREDYLKDALEVAASILEINETDGSLNEAELKRNRESIINIVGRELMNRGFRESHSFKRYMYPNTYLVEDLIDDKKEIIEIINDITSSDLLNMYKLIFKESLVGAFLMGNIKNEYLDYIRDIFKFENVSELDCNYNREIMIPRDGDDYKRVVDKDYKESILRIAYDCPSTSYKEMITYNLINRIIGSCGMILHKILRDKYKLVYHADCGYNKYTNLLVIRAYIDHQNEAKTIESIGEVFDLLRTDDYLLESLLNNVKESIDLSLYTKDERPGAVFDEMVCISLDFDVSDKVFKQTVFEITLEDVQEALRKIKKVKTHFYKGDAA